MHYALTISRKYRRRRDVHRAPLDLWRKRKYGPAHFFLLSGRRVDPLSLVRAAAGFAVPSSAQIGCRSIALVHALSRSGRTSGVFSRRPVQPGHPVGTAAGLEPAYFRQRLEVDNRDRIIPGQRRRRHALRRVRRFSAWLFLHFLLFRSGARRVPTDHTTEGGSPTSRKECNEAVPVVRC